MLSVDFITAAYLAILLSGCATDQTRQHPRLARGPTLIFAQDGITNVMSTLPGYLHQAL